MVKAAKSRKKPSQKLPSNCINKAQNPKENAIVFLFFAFTNTTYNGTKAKKPNKAEPKIIHSFGKAKAKTIPESKVKQKFTQNDIIFQLVLAYTLIFFKIYDIL